MIKNRKVRTLTLILLIAIATALLFTSCGEEVETKITNGDFELTTSGAAGWNISDYENDYNENDEASDITIGTGKDGNCLVITNNEANDARVYQTVEVKKKSVYKITVDIKTENVPEDGCGAIVSAIGCTEQSAGVTGDTDWTTQTVYVKTAKKQTSIELSFGLGGYSQITTGTAMFDNITITKVSSVPSGVSALTLYQSATKATATKSESDLSPWLKLLFAGLLIGLVALIIILGLKSDEAERKHKLTKDEQRKLDKKDLIFIIALTVLCSCFSFYKLGDTDTANTYWKSSCSGEYVIAEFDEITNITGMSHMSNVPKSGSYAVYYEETDGEGDYKLAFTIKSGVSAETETEKVQGSFFEWQVSKNVNFTTRRVKVESVKTGWALNEIGFLTSGDDGEYKVVKATAVDESYVDSTDGRPSNLFDEQDTVTAKVTYMNSTYFDEIYHVRTAYEFIKGWSIYETTHPPLGKILISVGIRIFGMNPFGWRFMGTLFGVLMVPLIYLFAAKLFKKRSYAVLSAGLICVEFMRLAHSRLATIDSYSTFFIMLMYYFMYDYFTIRRTDKKSTIRAFISLGLCGISFGLGAATKWTCLYAGAGLAILFFASEIFEAVDFKKSREINMKTEKWMYKRFLPTCAFCVVFFVIIPAGIYILSYLPWMPSNKNSSLLTVVYNNQFSMYNYHSNLNATHPYMSSWWSWPLDMRPIWLYLGDSASGNRATIASFGNPVIWLLSIPALLATVFYSIKKKEKKLLVILAAFALEFLPWILVTRCAFIYHFMPCVPFVILMIVYCIQKLNEDKVIPEWSNWIYLGIAAVAFIIYYPALTGMEVKQSYIEGLRLFSSWYF